MHSTTAAFSRRFLKILGLPRLSPSAGYLSALAQHHLDAVSYENVSKLLRFATGQRSLPTPEEYLNDLETNGFGGTCFAINSFFGTLLCDLGFDAELTGGLSGDETDSHLSLRINVDAQAYALDLGYMLPDPGPFPLAGPEVAVPSGNRVFKFTPHGDGRNYAIQLLRDGVVGRRFDSAAAARTLDDFAGPLLASFDASQMFMKTLCVHRRFKDHFRTIWGREFVRGRGQDSESRPITDRDDLVRILRDELNVSRCEIDLALDVVATHGGVGLF